MPSGAEKTIKHVIDCWRTNKLSTHDIIAIVKGQFVGIEVKADRTKKPTALQVKCGEEIQRAKGWWFLVCDEESLHSLEQSIEEKLYR